MGVKRLLRMWFIPGVPQVLQITLRCVHGRNFFDAFGGIRRKNCGFAVDTGVRQPRLRRRYQAAGVFQPLLMREHSDDGTRGIEKHEGRKQRFGPHFIGIHQLWNRKLLDRFVTSVGQGTVGGAEIDPDDGF